MLGAQGRRLKEEIEKKLEKLQEPNKQKRIKALPVPDEGPKKRRAGRRYVHASPVTMIPSRAHDCYP